MYRDIAMRLFFYVILCLMFVACQNQHRHEKHFTASERAEVDLETDDEVSFYDYFESVHIVQLENSPDAYFSSDRLLMAKTRNCFFILDKRTNIIRVFDAKGNLLEAVDKNGRGNGELSMASDMFFDTRDSTLTVLDAKGTILKYKPVQGLPFVTGYSVSDQLRAVHNFAPDGNVSGYFLFSIFTNPHIYHYDCDAGILDSVEYDYPTWVFGTPYKYAFSPFLAEGGMMFYYEGEDGAIYQVDEAALKLIPVLDWDFGQYGFSIDCIDNPENENRNYLRYLDSHSKQWAAPVHVEMMTSRIIVAKTFFRGKWRSLLYDRVNKKCVCFYEFTENFSLDVCFYSGDTGYLLIPPEYLKQFVNPSVLSDQESFAVFESVDEECNNIIVCYTLKR